MPSIERGPQNSRDIHGDTVPDRRRSGRSAVVNPALIPLMRGQFDPDAPAGPFIRAPGQIALDQELIMGAAIASTLLLLGALLKYVA